MLECFAKVEPPLKTFPTVLHYGMVIMSFSGPSLIISDFKIEFECVISSMSTFHCDICICFYLFGTPSNADTEPVVHLRAFVDVTGQIGSEEGPTIKPKHGIPAAQICAALPKHHHHTIITSLSKHSHNASTLQISLRPLARSLSRFVNFAASCTLQIAILFAALFT